MLYVLNYAEMLFGSLSIIIMDYHYVEFIVQVVLSEKFVVVAFDIMAICGTSCNRLILMKTYRFYKEKVFIGMDVA